MKSKEEILNEFGCPEIPFDENVKMYYPAILSAMEEYAQQFASQPPAPSGIEEAVNGDELWDEYSEYIDDDLDSLQMVAGRSVIKKESFEKMIAKLTASTPPAKEQWVKIEEGLPEEEEWVLVHNQEVDDCPVTIGVYVNGRWRILELGVDVEQIVTHWQPLPTPPTT